MKTNSLMDEIRETMSPEMKIQMELTVSIANRIYDILKEKGLSQKDLAHLLGKTGLMVKFGDKILAID